VPYRFGRKAAEDLENIAVYGVETFGVEQAKR